MNTNLLFLKTAPVKLFFLAAIPGAVSMLASSLYGLLDGIFVGNILGETAFAALLSGFIWLWFQRELKSKDET